MNKDHTVLRAEKKACSVSKSMKAPKWKNLLFFPNAAPGNNGGFVSQTLPWPASWWEKGCGGPAGSLGETETLVSGPGILPTEDTAAAACPRTGQLATVCGAISAGSSSQPWVPVRPELQPSHSQHPPLLVGMTFFLKE